MRFLLRRLGFFVLTLWAALTINFAIPRMLPGSPVDALIAKFHGKLTGASLQAMEAALGFKNHQSLLQQYLTYLKDCATLNFGVSSSQFPASVDSIVGAAIPWTLGLVGVTTVLAFVLGTAIGAIGAWKRGGKLDSVLPPLFVVGTGLPYFWIGIMLIMLFADINPWLPSAFGSDNDVVQGWNGAFVGSVVTHAVLPAASLLITSIGGWVLTMRNTMVTTLAEDYIRMARAKGLPAHRIMIDYAARNSILPNVTGFAMSMGFVVSGAVAVEYVFSYPGVGYQMVQAVDNEDFPVMQCLFLVITVAVLVSVLISDIATAILDPRTRSAR
ncbi:ABC transporter permease [Streptacidiphilus sp. PB12-B1b]|uniref:ABC transporter permease n=1 Tax=Streptacidiphilus sp. PB12-B1b TaxID=2705012 RepID=UPI0015FE3FAC|nr:ABC transporter permease [Streptacidiphilus sp. PB12-B1b]QMU77610.1 ABC transporter permease [Streptacidiphilus sp. PB12-B1b]